MELWMIVLLIVLVTVETTYSLVRSGLIENAVKHGTPLKEAQKRYKNVFTIHKARKAEKQKLKQYDNEQYQNSLRNETDSGDDVADVQQIEQSDDVKQDEELQ